MNPLSRKNRTPSDELGEERRTGGKPQSTSEGIPHKRIRTDVQRKGRRQLRRFGRHLGPGKKKGAPAPKSSVQGKKKKKKKKKIRSSIGRRARDAGKKKKKGGCKEERYSREKSRPWQEEKKKGPGPTGGWWKERDHLFASQRKTKEVFVKKKGSGSMQGGSRIRPPQVGTKRGGKRRSCGKKEKGTMPLVLRGTVRREIRKLREKRKGGGPSRVW